MRRRLVAPPAVVLLVALLLGLTPGSASSQTTPGLAEARAEVQRLADRIDETQGQLAGLESDIADLHDRETELRDRQDALRADVQELAIEQYTQGRVDPLFDPDPSRHLEATALSEIIGRSDRDTLDEFRAVGAQLDANQADLEARQAEQQDLLDGLQADKEAIDAELARLEQLELDRLAEERRQAELAARQAADAAVRRAAEERAARLAAEEDARRRVAEIPPQAAPPVIIPDVPLAPPPTGGGIVCPVSGSSFRNGFGDPRSGGRSHKGIDMMAPTGTPILAPVSGTVVHGADPLGGNNFNMNGDDGRGYYGAHLSAYGASGQVSAGTVIGYVGETGDAVGAHLHFEIHVGGVAINPYPELIASC